MQIRAVFLGMLPPRPGGATISLAQIVSAIARAGHEVCALAPITTETMAEGDWYAAQHPELRVIRYWMPAYYLESHKPLPVDAAQLEKRQVRLLVHELFRSFRPNLLIAGHENFGYLIRELAEQLAIPWTLWLRGSSPTAQLVSGLGSGEQATFLDLCRSAGLLISVARYLSDGLERRWAISGIRYIPNAVALDVFARQAPSQALRAQLGIADGSRVVLWPGNFVVRKRPIDCLKAAELVLAQNPAVTFLLVGGGTCTTTSRPIAASGTLRAKSGSWVGCLITACRSSTISPISS